MNRNALVLVCATFVALGAFFRLFHADWKLYSYDETITSLRAAGHTYAEFEAFVHDGRAHRISDLAPFQAPAASTDERAVWRSLALEDPQHPPLYFWVTSLSQRVTGDSVFARRLPAVVFGLLTLPAAWWLAYELFGDALAAWLFAALVAVSPFHVAYAQQAREYSFWTLGTLVSSALLLRALATGKAWTWFAYAFSVAATLWGFAFFSEVVAAQMVYVLGPWCGAPPRRRLYAALAAAAGIATFVPWLRVIARGAGTALSDTGWTAAHLSLPLYLGKWLFNAGSVFFDLDYLTLALLPVATAFVALAIACCYALVRRAPHRVWSFVALLGGMSALVLLIPDVLLHQSRAGQSRYLTPLWLALELATAYGLAAGAFKAKRAGRRRQIVIATTLAAGIVSCGVAAYARTWWLANNEKSLPAIGMALAAQSGATLVYVDDDDMLLELLPASRPGLTFDLHRDLDEPALRSAADAYAIAKPADVDASPIARSTELVALPATFPPAQDRFIEWLRRRAAAERKMTAAASQADALYRAGTQR